MGGVSSELRARVRHAGGIDKNTAGTTAEARGQRRPVGWALPPASLVGLTTIVTLSLGTRDDFLFRKRKESGDCRVETPNVSRRENDASKRRSRNSEVPDSGIPDANAAPLLSCPRNGRNSRERLQSPSWCPDTTLTCPTHLVSPTEPSQLPKLRVARGLHTSLAPRPDVIVIGRLPEATPTALGFGGRPCSRGPPGPVS